MLEREVEGDYKKQIKDKAKQKLREIKMAQITLTNLRKELKEMLEGKKRYTEEELLFGEG